MSEKSLQKIVYVVTIFLVYSGDYKRHFIYVRRFQETP